jgi:hypothetical protein
MSNLFKRHTPLFDNPTTFQDLNPGECCVDDVFLNDATIALNGAGWELTLTLNDGTTHVVPFPTEFTDDIRVASFTRHPDALTNPAFVNTIRIVLTDSTIFDLDLSFLSGGGGGGEDLAATLVLGNTTGGENVITSDGDKIVPANGNVILDLRATGVNDFWFLGNDASGGAFTGPFGSMVYGNATTTSLLFDTVRYGVVIEANGALIGTVDPSSPAAYLTIVPGRTSVFNEATLTLPTDTIEGSLTIIQNSVSNRSFRSIVGTTTAVNINSGSGGPNSTVINLGVANSVAVGGFGLTVKTSNTVYVNQISLQFPLNSFDTVLRPSAATADRTISLQDGDGTLAFLNDIPGSYAEDLNSALPSITRVFAGGRTTFTVTHGLNTLDVKPQVYRLSDGRTVNWRIERTGVNTIEASRAGNVADGLFRITI